jgi:hypothetical protein
MPVPALTEYNNCTYQYCHISITNVERFASLVPSQFPRVFHVAFPGVECSEVAFARPRRAHAAVRILRVHGQDSAVVYRVTDHADANLEDSLGAVPNDHK